MELDGREKKLLEALYDRYGPKDSYPTFEAEWIEEEGGRKYYHVTGTFHYFGGTLARTMREG